MGTLNQDLTGIKAIEDKINANKVATFAYTETAYQDPLQYADGVMVYDVNNPQNIPVGSPEALRVNETILAKGWRSQASSISRMLMNHFLGRCSYNLNQVNDQLGNLLSTLISHLGSANGIATLDANGRIPYAQLPESAMEFKGTWNAQTNTPQLVNGSGTNGDFYVCNVAGTTNFGAGDITFLVNDRAIYDGSVWSKLSAGDIRSVDGFSPDPATGNVTLRPAFSAESAPASNLVSGSTLPTLFGRIAGWINNFISHRNNTSNPHSVTKSQVGLGSVVNTGDSANTADGGTTKFTTGGARNVLASIAPYFSESTTYRRGALVTYQNKLYECTVGIFSSHTGAWNDDHFTAVSLTTALPQRYVPITRQVNGHFLMEDINITKSDVGLGSVQDKGMTDFPVRETAFGAGDYLASYGLFSALRNHLKSRSFALNCTRNYSIAVQGVTNIVDVEKIVDTSHNVTFYLVATQTGVFKCSDADGQDVIAEMKYLDVSMTGVNKIVNAYFGGLIYVCTQHGIFRTDDYGASWVRALPEGNNGNCTDLKVVPRELINSSCYGRAVAIVNGYLYTTNNKFSAYERFSSYYSFSSIEMLDRTYAIGCTTDSYGASFVIDTTSGSNWTCDPSPECIGGSYPYFVGTARMKDSNKRSSGTSVNRVFTIYLSGLTSAYTAKIKRGNNTWIALYNGSLYRLRGMIWSAMSINDTIGTVDGFEYCREGYWVAWKNNGEFIISRNDGDSWEMLDYFYTDTIPTQIFGVKDLRDGNYRLGTLKVFADTGVFEIISEDYWGGIYE